MFNKSDLEKCEKNECSNCARCCAVLSVTLPENSRDLLGKKFKKNEGIQCKYLIRKKDKFGDLKYLCSLHDKKHFSCLKVCQEFKGGDIRTYEGEKITNYELVKRKTRELIIHCGSEDILYLIIIMLEDGRLSDISPFNLEIEDENEKHKEYWDFIAFLFAHLNVLQIISKKLFDFMKVKKMISQIKSSENFSIEDVFKRLNMNRNKLSKIHREFLEKYC